MEKILDWFKKYQKYVLIGAGIVLLLVAAFWYGSGSPDSKGFQVANGQNVSGQMSQKTDKDTRNDSENVNVTEEAITNQEQETDAALVAQETDGQSGKKNSSSSGNTGNDGNTGNGGNAGNNENTGSAGNSGYSTDTSQKDSQSSQTNISQ